MTGLNEHLVNLVLTQMFDSKLPVLCLSSPRVCFRFLFPSQMTHTITNTHTNGFINVFVGVHCAELCVLGSTQRAVGCAVPCDALGSSLVMKADGHYIRVIKGQARKVRLVRDSPKHALFSASYTSSLSRYRTRVISHCTISNK